MTAAPRDPGPPAPLSARGVALLDAGRADEAVEVLLHALAAGEPGADDLLARAYLDGRDWFAAADHLRRLVRAGHVQFAGRLGVALAEIGEVDRAETAFRFALDKGELAAANDLAILLNREGRFDEVVPLLRWAADAGEPHAAANLVELLLEAGQLGSATQVAERYAHDSRPDTQVALADVRAAVGRADEAEALYRRAGELGALRGHSAYGAFLASVRSDPEAAEREFREAGRHDEPGWEFALGRFLVDDGRSAEARPYVAAAAATGDEEAVRLLAEIDGEDPYDD
jgi:Tfp pilus assembly protein PilF